MFYNGITREYVIQGEFLDVQENLIFYGGIGTGKTFLSTLITLNIIKNKGEKGKILYGGLACKCIVRGQRKENSGEINETI